MDIGLKHAPASRNRPVVGVLSNAIMDGTLPAQSVDHKYLDALMQVADVAVVIIPALNPHRHLSEDILQSLDGVMLTGAVSNVHPRHFDPDADEHRHLPFDQERDNAALELISHALAYDVPLLAICRGMQELNVSRGGTLTPDIHSDDKFFCHDAWDKSDPPHVLYAPSHAVTIADGGILGGVLGAGTRQVNSLHVQAIDRLGDGLMIEAVAQDGTVEAVSIPDKRFALGVQWHPEFMASDNDVSRRIFQAFGAAARSYQMFKAMEPTR
ncbi:gamma-glutamyl-gamma-aminobutyrate hydrolase family protein [Noviherbaspirillum saxi]|uniref:gamma-glutamyl-gamma-aminobutyrate hydrolase n=1 Tax=Noviherbaspirillum saxi TaxID=2320863 RepID=A0A3A3FT20_9BURK|nr:gamma-glutamyl-gamma-aminobutyrate hydrolase family protein [Noviherbaspirillum saxi]RJF99332.1 gamma-glutamyl-gamma-aminobutyrate hydrolase family protein [Noviherbaspirillum saxi]